MDSINQLLSFCMQHNCELSKQQLNSVKEQSTLSSPCLPGSCRHAVFLLGQGGRTVAQEYWLLFVPLLPCLWLEADPVSHVGSLAIFILITCSIESATFQEDHDYVFFTGGNPMIVFLTLWHTVTLCPSYFPLSPVYTLLSAQNSDFFLCLEVKWQWLNYLGLVQESAFTTVY